jgi:hypothetical protein
MIEPAFVVLLTALLVTISENALTMALQPVTRAKAHAVGAALKHARRRSLSLFALEAPFEEAKHAAATFDEQIEQWEYRREDATRRDRVGSAARAAVAAAAFAASGGCLVAPVIASLGVVVNPDELPLVAPSSEEPPIEWAAGFILLASAWASSQTLM